MGSNIIQRDIHIGEIQLNGKKANLTVDCGQASRFSMIVQNKDGRPVIEETMQLNSGEQDLSFDFSSLKNGDYNAWIEADGKTFIRSFSIETDDDGGFLEKMKKLFR